MLRVTHFIVDFGTEVKVSTAEFFPIVIILGITTTPTPAHKAFFHKALLLHTY